MAIKYKTTMDDAFHMPGSRVRDTHAATVRGIVGARDIPVRSGGTSFRMKGPFAWRHVGVAIGKGMTDVDAITSTANREAFADPAVSIQIAECPDDLSRRVYMALIGGACHESFHAVYSYQGRVTPEMVRDALAPMLANPGLPWAQHAGLVLELQNVFEDTAIERIGNAEFPGVFVKMVDLAEFIIRQENEARAEKGIAMTLPCAVFTLLRDVGLGYSTQLIRDNVETIKRECPQGAAMLAPGGLLRDVLERSIPDVSSADKIAAAKRAIHNGHSLKLALEAVVLLAQAITPPPSQGDNGDQGQSQKGPKPGQGTPSQSQQGQGTPDPNQSGQGTPSQGKPSPSQGTPSQGTPSQGKPTPSQTDDTDEGDDGMGEGGDDANEGDEAEASGSDTDSGDDTDGDDDGEGDDTDEGDDTATGADTDNADGEPNGDAGDTTESDADPDYSDVSNLERNNTPAQEGSKGNPNGAGGGEGNSSDTAQDFLDQFQASGAGTMDASSALESGVAGETDPNTKPDERPYQPYSTSEDTINLVKANEQNAQSFRTLANKARKATSFLRTRLATMFRAMEQTGAEHGIRKGARVSDRMLVNTYCELRGGMQPSRAYMDKAPVLDLSIAAALVIDESSSMSDKLGQTCAGAYTLMDSLDGIGAKTMAVGFRSGNYINVDYNEARDMQSHRAEAIKYDIFKGWQDTFKVAAPRLKEIRAEGGTPMADGVEFALRELSNRPEGYRILFVLTDGQPNGGHLEVMKGQLRRAADAGVLVVGVGLGYGSEYVEQTFPDSVYAADLDSLPKALVAKLESLVRNRAVQAKRGRKVSAA